MVFMQVGDEQVVQLYRRQRHVHLIAVDQDRPCQGTPYPLAGVHQVGLIICHHGICRPGTVRVGLRHAGTQYYHPAVGMLRAAVQGIPVQVNRPCFRQCVRRNNAGPGKRIILVSGSIAFRSVNGDAGKKTADK